MKINFILILLCFWTINLSAQTVKYKHDWEVKYLEHDVQFTSKRKAPIPFSTTGEPQAIIIVGSSELDPSSKSDLNNIIKDEVDDIRKQSSIIEYLEEDYQPIDNIVTYYENIESVKIGIIKYRTNGMKGESMIMPRSVRHILFINNNKLYISSLIVLYAEDKENIQSDQMTFIKDIINHK